MVRKLTRAQFQQEYGVSVEDYLASQQAQPSLPEPTSQSRSLYDDPAVRESLQDAVVSRDKPEISDPTVAQQAGMTGLMPRPLERLQQNAIAGIAALPAGPAAVVGLARTGVPAVLDYMMSGDDDASLGKMFEDRIFDKDAQKALEQDLTQAVDRFRNDNPYATQADIDKFYEQYTKSDAYYDKVTSLMPGDLRFAREWQDKANKFAGLDARSDEMTAGDEVTQAISSSFVGLPAATAGRLAQRAARVVGDRVAQNMAVRVGVRAAEAFTPLTLPLTPANIALNAAAGSALTEGVRYAQGEDTLIDYDGLFETVDKQPALSVAAGLGLAAIAPTAFSRAAQRVASRNTGDALTKLAEKNEGAPSLGNQSLNSMEPTINPTTGLADETSQLTKAAQSHGATTDQLDDLEIAATAGGFNARKEIENRIHNYGELDGTHKTVPLSEIDRSIQSLNPQAQERLQDYLMAVSRKQDTDLQMKMYERQIADALNDVQSAKLRNNTQAQRAAETRLVEAQQAYRQILDDTIASRPSKQQWSRSDVDAAIDAGNRIPEFVKIKDAITKFADDMLAYGVRHGVLSKDAFDELRRGRPLFFPLRERMFPEASGLKRRALLYGKKLRDEFRAREIRDDAPDVLQSRGRNLSVRESGKVNQEVDVMTSLRQMTSDIVQQVQTNSARKQIIDTLRNLPDAVGSMLRPKRFRSGNAVTDTITPAQFAKWQQQGGDASKFVMVHDTDGRIQLWEFADEGIKSLLKFQPSASVPIMNSMRKLYQQGLTGALRPAFAATNLYRETGNMMVTRPSGRTVGFIDTFLHRLGEGTMLDTIGQNIPDYTAYLNSMTQIPIQLWQRGAKALSHKIMSDLTHDQGIFASLVRDPGGRAYVENIANRMATSLEQTSYGLMTKRMSTSFGHMNDINDIMDDFSRGAQRNKGVLRASLNMYKAMLESVHMANRVAFWSTNLGNLSHKYGGINNIPERELRKLELDTRNLGGDMSKRSKSTGVQRTMSVIPYGNTIIQGTRHFLAASVPHTVRSASNKHLGTNFLLNQKNNFWPIFVSGIVMPKVASMAMISDWEGAEQWWYGNTPAWQRLVTMPVPKVEAIEHRIRTGSWPAGDPGAHMYKIPIPPEFALLLGPIEAGVRAALPGVVGEGGPQVPDFLRSSGQVFSELASVPMPPALGMGMAWMGMRGDVGDMIAGEAPYSRQPAPMAGANFDKVSPGNSMSTWVYDMIGAIAGTGAQNIADALNVGELALKDGQSISESLQKAFSTYVHEARQGLPQTGVPYLWDVQERKYANTPDADYVFSTQEALEPVWQQLIRERDTSERAALVGAAGGELGPLMKDKRLLGISEIVYDTIHKKGEYKAADDQYRDIKTMLSGLPRQRLSTKEYQRRKDALVSQQQVLRSTQARILRNLESLLGARLGDKFEQAYGVPFTYANLAKLVRQDVSR